MKILGNSNCGLILNQKYLIYQSCVLFIVLYSFQLQFYNHAPLSYPLKMLGKMQRRATLWILGAFKMSPILNIEAITGLIPINLHFQKLGGRSQLRMHSLPPNHIIHSLMEPKSSSTSSLISQHLSLLGFLTRYQCELIISHVVNMNNRFNEVFPSFSSLHLEFTPGNKVIDNFSDQFSFNLYNKRKDNNIKSRIQQLDKITIKSSSDPSCALVIMDTSVKNNIATSILHTHVHNRPLIKMVYHVVHITSLEAELFAIRCGINQATNLSDISKIIVVTDSIHAAKRIFDLSFSSLHCCYT